ncbi:hypothetical protein F4802DRAFT_174536 [Xylaria palmicola]|nr:hypothetical protein F4802DRAFT_174536 [Xylaria palmicola]
MPFITRIREEPCYAVRTKTPSSASNKSNNERMLNANKAPFVFSVPAISLQWLMVEAAYSLGLPNYAATIFGMPLLSCYQNSWLRPVAMREIKYPLLAPSHFSWYCALVISMALAMGVKVNDRTANRGGIVPLQLATPLTCV